MELDPQDLDLASRYRLMIGAIVPRPIALVSTVSPEGAPNLAPFSFFNGVGSNPMTLVFCPANDGEGAEKDTLRNCKPRHEGGTGEFVVNLATEDYYREVTAASEPLPPEESEFALTGLATAASRLVRPPRVAASPVAFECRTTQVVRTHPGAPAGGNAVFGEVVAIHVDEEVTDARLRIDARRLRAVGRMGGTTYCTTRQRFDVPRGRAALDQPGQLDDLL